MAAFLSWRDLNVKIMSVFNLDVYTIYFVGVEQYKNAEMIKMQNDKDDPDLLSHGTLKFYSV